MMANGMNAPKKAKGRSNTLMAQSILETSRRTYLMAMERRPKQMAPFMWVNSPKACSKVKESSNGRMAPSMKANGKPTR